jgi:uncharacterized membrane protein (DUF4010 family)
MDDISAIPTFLTSLGLGLLIGLERERHASAKAGLRTFALVAILGTASGLLSERLGSAWILAAGVLVLGAMMIVAHSDATADPNADPGTTTTVALVMCYVIGAMLWYGHRLTATLLALTVTALLYFKTELQNISSKLSRRDIVSFLQFAVLAFVVVPSLPNRGYGPNGALNPYALGLMMVVVSGVSLAGYAALRIAGEQRGLPLIGGFGGLVSSTATTLVFSREVRRGEASADVAAVIVLEANVVALLRMLALAAIFAPALLLHLAPVFVFGAAVGIVAPWRLWRGLKSNEKTAQLEIANPAELLTALATALIFALVMLSSSWLVSRVGTVGVYSASALFGFTDLDAISLSTLRMLNTGQLMQPQAVTALLVAYCSNMVLKLIIAGVVGGRTLLRRVGTGYLLIFVALLGAWWAANILLRAG